jgi:hypothetical protein
MVNIIIAPFSSLEYSAFITSANALRLGTSPIFDRKDEEQLYHHMLQKYFIENSGKQIAMIQTHVFSL